MSDYDVRPLQLRLLHILDTFHKVCEERGLKYYLVDGTLLGAVRHGGFIPWDDDLDIAMPREDYETLISHASEWLPEPLEFVCQELDSAYPLQFGKIQDASTTLVERPHLFYLGGIYIDVFPIDGAPRSLWQRRIHNARYQFLRKALYFSCRDPYRHGKGPSAWFPLAVRTLLPPRRLQMMIKKEMTRYPLSVSSLAGINLNDGLKAILPKDTVLGDPSPLRFETGEYWGMNDNHVYLKSLFGDYMTPPPAGKRHVHGFSFLDLDRPYKEYDEAELRRRLSRKQ